MTGARCFVVVTKKFRILDYIYDSGIAHGIHSLIIPCPIRSVSYLAH